MDAAGASDQEIVLRTLDPDEVGEYYVDWMNDPAVVKYLESRFATHTLASIRQYVREMNASPSDLLLGIFLAETGQHIGNIKIGEVNRAHRFANLGLLIGEKSARGRGIGTRAIVLATRIAFRDLHLRCLTAGIYADNPSSYRAFLKAGWKEAGRYKNYRLSDGNYVDQINVQACNDA
jgi:[ribosomal protein S5]-alanine N-acetyltransferase